VLAFQQPVLYPLLDVFDNVAFGLKIGGVLDKAERRQRIKRALEITGLGGFERHQPLRAFGRYAATRGDGAPQWSSRGSCC
jgi:ABC-type Fe3+/spermidine/putrescine transport system ATPase subunit